MFEQLLDAIYECIYQRTNRKLMGGFLPAILTHALIHLKVEKKRIIREALVVD